MPEDATDQKEMSLIGRSSVPVAQPHTAGKTNGRTNGRTNGLTNGTGKTNGLVNGIISGLGTSIKTRAGVISISESRRKKLTEGPAVARGLTNGNGLINGNGLTNGNGLINGKGLTNGKRFLYGDKLPVFPRTRRGIVYGVVFIVILTLVIGPYFYINGLPDIITIDGAFGDWEDSPKFSDSLGDVANEDIDLKLGSMVKDEKANEISVYVQTEGTMLRGGATSHESSSGEKVYDGVDTIDVFIDLDSDASTGYSICGIGADARMRVVGWGNLVKRTNGALFDDTRAKDDWNGFSTAFQVAASCDGSELEAQMDLDNVGKAPKPRAVIISSDNTGARDEFDLSFTPDDGALSATPLELSLTTISPGSFSNCVSSWKATAQHKSYKIDGATVARMGTCDDSDIGTVSVFADSNGNGKFDEREDAKLGSSQLSGGMADVPFSEPYELYEDETMTFFATVDVPSGTPEDRTIGLSLSSLATADGYVSITKTCREVAHIGPSDEIVIDGAFADWDSKRELPDAQSDVKRLTTNTPGKGNTLDQALPNIDISGMRIAEDNGKLSFYLRVEGEMMGGAATLDDVTERFVDMQSISTGGVHSGELPALPVKLGEDMTCIYIDSDGDPSTGYQYCGLGADHLISITGKYGIVKESNLSVYDDKLALWRLESNVSVGIDAHRLETQILLSSLGSGDHSKLKVAFRTTSWSGAFDELSEGREGDRTYPTGSVWINEVSPSGKWVELWCNSTTAVSIQNWYIYGVNANRWYRLTGTIGAKSYRVFLSISWLTGNEHVILFSPNNDPNPDADPYVTEDSVQYNINPSASNWGRDNYAGDGMGSWTTTSLDTQGTTNVVVVVPEFGEIALPIFASVFIAAIALRKRAAKEERI